MNKRRKKMNSAYGYKNIIKTNIDAANAYPIERANRLETAV